MDFNGSIFDIVAVVQSKRVLSKAIHYLKCEIIPQCWCAIIIPSCFNGAKEFLGEVRTCTKANMKLKHLKCFFYEIIHMNDNSIALCHMMKHPTFQ